MVFLFMSQAVILLLNFGCVAHLCCIK